MTSHNTHLFEAIETIVQVGYVLVQDSENRIAGIVTASDLSEQFHQLTEPFLLLSEVERRLRRMIDGKVNAEELAQARYAGDSGRDVRRVDDLSFGELVRLIDNPAIWERLRLNNIHRPTVTGRLKEINRIRNDVMHFNPDPNESDVGILKHFSRFLQQLDELLPQ